MIRIAFQRDLVAALHSLLHIAALHMRVKSMCHVRVCCFAMSPSICSSLVTLEQCPQQAIAFAETRQLPGNGCKHAPPCRAAIFVRAARM